MISKAAKSRGKSHPQSRKAEVILETRRDSGLASRTRAHDREGYPAACLPASTLVSQLTIPRQLWP